MVFVALLATIPGFALAQSSSANSLYVSSEQVLAVPSKSGATLQALLTVNIQNVGATTSVSYAMPSGANHLNVVAGTVKSVAVDQHGRLRFYAVGHSLTTFAIEFQVPLNQNGTELTWQEPFAVRKLFFVIPEGALTVSAEGGFQTDSQAMMSGTHVYRQFTELDIGANEPWTVAVALLPTANGKQAPPLTKVRVLNSYGSRVADFEAVANLILVVLILALGVFSIRSQTKWRGQTSLTDFRKQKANLMEGWADLEQARQGGKIGEKDYRARRERMVERALQLEMALRQRQGQE